jgi:hypothetical protein
MNFTSTFCSAKKTPELKSINIFCDQNPRIPRDPGFSAKQYHFSQEAIFSDVLLTKKKSFQEILSMGCVWIRTHECRTTVYYGATMPPY